MAADKNQNPQRSDSKILTRLRSLTLTKSPPTTNEQNRLNEAFLTYCKDATQHIAATTFLCNHLSNPKVAISLATTKQNEPIHWAAKHGNTGLADHILTAADEQKDAMLESERDELFQEATENNHLEFMQWLITKTPDPTKQSQMLHAKEDRPFRASAQKASIATMLLILRLTSPTSQSFQNIMNIIQTDLIAGGKIQKCFAALHSITFLLDNTNDYVALKKWCVDSSSSTLQNPTISEYLLNAIPLCKIGAALQDEGYNSQKAKALEDLFVSTMNQREDSDDSSLDNRIQSTSLVTVYAMKAQYRNDRSLMHLSEVALSDNSSIYLQALAFKQHLLAKISFREKLLQEVSSSSSALG
jgi:hypothetical protein